MGDSPVMRRRTWAALAAFALAMVVFSVFGLLDRPDDATPPARSPTTADRDTPDIGENGLIEEAVKLIPDGSIGPIITDPDPNRIPLCDDRNWPRIAEIVVSVGPARGAEDHDGVAYVESDAWQSLSRGARSGIASWASKCRLDDGSVLVQDARTGADLGRYDASSGFRGEPEPESNPESNPES